MLAQEGISLILVARSPVQMDGHITHLADLATKEGIDSVLKLIDEHRPSLVVNNAAIGFYGSCITQETISEMIEVNCSAVAQISRHAAKRWIESGREGIVLNVSSVLDHFAAPHAAVYAATKSFVTSFSRAFDFELQQQGVRVLCAAPGRVATGFGFRTQQKGVALDPRQVALALVQQVKNKRGYQCIDWRYRVVAFLAKLVPQSLISWGLSRYYTNAS